MTDSVSKILYIEDLNGKAFSSNYSSFHLLYNSQSVGKLDVTDLTVLFRMERWSESKYAIFESINSLFKSFF